MNIAEGDDKEKKSVHAARFYREGRAAEGAQVSPLKLETDFSISGIEGFIRRISGSAGAPLLVNQNFIGVRKGAMHDAARLQMLTTWARSAKEKSLHFDPQSSKEKRLEELCGYSPGIAVLRLCEEVSIGGVKIPRKEALVGAIGRMRKIDDFERMNEIVKGRIIDLICVSGAKVQYLRPLFNARNKWSLKNQGEMILTMRMVINYIAQDKRGRIARDVLEECALFFRELMKNTQEHATSDHMNRSYIEHVEGVIFSCHIMYEKDYKKDFAGNSLLLEFWDDNKTYYKDGRDEGLHCLQMSFFDTGPGFASRATGRALDELSLEEEENAFFDCLKKHFTTKKETGAGNGLSEVLVDLDKLGGLISIRSGRLRKFNVLKKGGRGLTDFVDWFGGERELAPVVGAVVSLLIPIGKKCDE